MGSSPTGAIMIWFTSDTHFGHANIIKHCNRPFASVEEMDNVLIDNINQRVKRDDILFHLGDFAWRNAKIKSYRPRIICNTIHLIRGNHDPINPEGFTSVSNLMDTVFYHNNHTIVITLCHYAMRIWNKKHYGAWHLYGHSHGKLNAPNGEFTFDVGVDVWNFCPINIDQVIAKMQTIDKEKGL